MERTRPTRAGPWVLGPTVWVGEAGDTRVLGRVCFSPGGLLPSWTRSGGGVAGSEALGSSSSVTWTCCKAALGSLPLGAQDRWLSEGGWGGISGSREHPSAGAVSGRTVVLLLSPQEAPTGIGEREHRGLLSFLLVLRIEPESCSIRGKWSTAGLQPHPGYFLMHSLQGDGDMGLFIPHKGTAAIRGHVCPSVAPF